MTPIRYIKHPAPDPAYAEASYSVEYEGKVIGEVYRIVVSTDSQIKGTRLRRSGRGRPGWKARILLDDGVSPACREIVRMGYPNLRLDNRGTTFDLRLDAARALREWNASTIVTLVFEMGSHDHSR